MNDCAALSAAVRVHYSTTRRWLEDMGHWPHVGSGFPVRLADRDFVAVAVAVAVAGRPAIGGGDLSVRRRALRAGETAAECPDAEFIVATPTAAHPYESAVAALADWIADGRPPCAIVPLAAVLAPVQHLLSRVAA